MTPDAICRASDVASMIHPKKCTAGLQNGIFWH